MTSYTLLFRADRNKHQRFCVVLSAVLAATVVLCLTLNPLRLRVLLSGPWLRPHAQHVLHTGARSGVSKQSYNRRKALRFAKTQR